MLSALASAPEASARLADSTRWRPATSCRPACSARSAAISHQGPGSPDGHPRPRAARAAQLASLGREQLAEHRLSRERVPEAERFAVCFDELLVDREAKCVDDGAAVDLRERGKQLPVEAPPEQRRGPQHPARRLVEHGEPLAHRLGEVERDRWREAPRRRPAPVIEAQRVGCDKAGDELLDEERVALAVRRHALDHRGRRVVDAEAARDCPFDP